MAAGEEKLRLVLAAIDKTAAPIRAVNRRIEGMLAPIRKVKGAFAALAREAGLPKLASGLATVGRALAKVAVVGTGAAVGLFEFVRRTAESADELGDFVSGIGIGVEKFQEIQYAAQIAGVSNEDFSNSISKLSKNLGDLKAGTGPLETLLKNVAPRLRQQLKATTDLGDATEILFDAMRRLPDASKRNSLAAAAFGRSGQALTRITSVSAEKFADLVREARELGVAFSQEAADSAGDATDAMDRLKTVVRNLAGSIGSALFPVLTENADALREWIMANRVEIVEKAKEAVLALAEGVRQLGAFLIESTPKVVELVDTLGGMKTVLLAIAAISLAPLVASLVSIGVALGPVGLAITAIAGSLAFMASLNWDSVKAGILSGLGAFGFDVGPRVQAPRAPGAGAGGAASAADAAAAASRVDLQGNINLQLPRGLRATGATSSLPGLGFTFDRGSALSPA